MSDSKLVSRLVCYKVLYLPTDAVLGLQLMLQHLNEVRNEWFMIGIALGVPLTKLREIEASYTKEGTMRCMLEMVQYWLDTTPAACWDQVARALEQINQLTLAATIKQRYLWDQPPSEWICVQVMVWSILNFCFFKLLRNPNLSLHLQSLQLQLLPLLSPFSVVVVMMTTMSLHLMLH